MKKLVSIITVVGFVTVMVFPISSLAGDEIQLAAAIGGSDDNSASKLIGKKVVVAPPPTPDAGAGLSVATIATIGVAVGGLMMAVKKTDSSSSH